MLRVTQVLPDRSRLDADESLTIDAITAIVLRDVERGVNAYRQLAERRPREAGVWLDLGRAQEAAAVREEARRSYERATEIDSQYAAAYLRLGSLDAQEGRRTQAEAAIENAERLYKIASSAEGQTEALLRRGSFLNDLGEVAAARSALERAHMLASSMGSRYHEIRAQLQLTAVTASEGRLRDAELLATQAVDAARDANLDTVAAEGLVELGTALQLRRDYDAAQAQLDRAIALAEERGARRVATRARLQFASLLLLRGKPGTLSSSPRTSSHSSGPTVPAIRADRPRHHLARPGRPGSVTGRARDGSAGPRDRTEDSGRHAGCPGARQPCRTVVDAGVSAGGTSLSRARGRRYIAGKATPTSWPSISTNRAELLIRLGHGEKAETLLREVDAGIAKGIDAYVGRARRQKVLRTLRATIDRRYMEAITLGLEVGPAQANARWDRLLASALVNHARARLRKGGAYAEPPLPPSLALPTAREIRYWRIATRLASGEAAKALADASALLEDMSRAPSSELEWR